MHTCPLEFPDVFICNRKAGGPYYPVFTGRKDSTRSHYAEAMRDIPGPFDDVNSFLHLFSVRGFSMREIVSLLGTTNSQNLHFLFIILIRFG